MSTFENDLRLEEIGTGERAGTWGTATNVNLELIANALSYSATGEAIANASTHTITMADGAADEFRSFYLKCTGGGQACTVTLAPNTLSKVWMIENTTSATLTFSQGSGANVAILAGQVKVIGTNGVGSAAAVFDLLQDLAVPDLFVDDDLTLQSDAAVLGFGENKDVTLTHVHNTGLLLNAAMKVQFRDAAIFIGSSGADVLDIASDGVINLTATTDVVIPANVGLTFGTGEKIEGDSTDLTITSGAKINLTATSDIVVPADVGITFGTGEKIEGDNTDLTVTSGADINLTATADVNIPSGVGLTFGDDGEKIEGDGTDLTISGNNINLTAVADIIVPADVGITFGTGEKIEGDNTDLTITSGADINLTATADINIPADVGLTFGDDGEKIEGDGTDLTIAGNNINLTAVADVVIPANVGLTFGTGEKIEGDSTDLTVTSGAKINLAATSDVHLANNIGMVFGDAGEKIEGDGTNLAINSSGDVNITATTVDIDGNLEVSGSITLGSGAVIVEAELELLDGITPGTAIATKVVTTDANIDTTGQRNLTITGELDAATGDFSGIVDVAGVLTVSNTTASSSSTSGSLIVGGGLGVAADLFVGDDFDVTGDAVIDGTTLVTGVLTTTAATIFNGGFASNANSTVGGTLGVTGVVTANAGVVVDNFTLDGTTLALSSGDLTIDAAGDIILDADGAEIIFKDAGTQIGRIRNVSSGEFTFQSDVSDKDIVFNGNDGGATVTALTLDMSDGGSAYFNHDIFLDQGSAKIRLGTSSDVLFFANGSDGVIDAAGDIVLDAAGRDIKFQQDGTLYLSIFNDVSNNAVFNSIISDKDIVFTGNDGGSAVTALTLDMSAAGAATFNSHVTAGGEVRTTSINTASSTGTLVMFGGASNKGGTIELSGGNNTGSTGSGIVFKTGASTTNPAQRMAIDLNGNVGIGVAPSNPLHVASSLANGAVSFFHNTDTSNGQGILVRGGGSNSGKYIAQFQDAAANVRMQIFADGKVGIGTASPTQLIQISGNSSSSDGISYVAENTRGAGGPAGLIMKSEHGDWKMITSQTVADALEFIDGGSTDVTRMLIDSSGNLIVGEASASAVTNGQGAYLASNGQLYASSSSSHFFNKQADGDILFFRSAGASEGVISISGSTTTYTGFSGRHESSGIPTNTPVGTVVSTIDALDVYPDRTTDTDGNAIDHLKAGQTRADHAKVKVSDTSGDACVYGVVANFNDDGKLIVTSVGIGSVRVTGACSKGDLLESNGDGTAIVQSDDIVRSKTLGKVTIGNSNTGVKLVSCVMYCG